MDTYEKAGKHYGIAFLINSDQNAASLPAPWKVSEEHLIRIANTAKGKPWLPGGPPGSNKHHFKVDASPKDEMGQRRNIQEHYKRAKGIITDVIQNHESGNVSVIIELDPEYAKKIDHKQVSAFVSPMIEGIVQDPETFDIIDGEIIHIHSVDSPGYKPSVAKFFGTCEGTHQECKIKLTPLAAAGTAATEDKSYFNRVSNKPLYMDEPMTPPPTGGAPPAGQDAPGIPAGGDLEQIKATVVEIGEEVQRVETLIDENSAVTQQLASAAGMDPNQVQMCKQQGQQPAAAMGPPQEAVPGMPPQQPQAAMGHQMGAAAGGLVAATAADAKVLKLEQQITLMKQQIADQSAKAAIAERKRMAEIIAKGQITLGLNKVTKKDYQTIVDKYVTMKHTSNPNQLMDLTLMSLQFQEVLNGLSQPPADEPAAVAQTAPAQVAAPPATEEPLTVVAASGYPFGWQPTTTPATKINYDELEANLL